MVTTVAVPLSESELSLETRTSKRVLAEELVDASDRAASLTRQLLTFSRRQTMQKSTIDINCEEPRALAVSGDGSEVYVAVFRSSNSTTLLSIDLVKIALGQFDLGPAAAFSIIGRTTSFMGSIQSLTN